MGCQARSQHETARLLGTSWRGSYILTWEFVDQPSTPLVLRPNAPSLKGCTPAATECNGPLVRKPPIASRSYWPAIKAATCGVPIPVTGSQPVPAE